MGPWIGLRDTQAQGDWFYAEVQHGITHRQVGQLDFPQEESHAHEGIRGRRQRPSRRQALRHHRSSCEGLKVPQASSRDGTSAPPRGLDTAIEVALHRSRPGEVRRQVLGLCYPQALRPG